jgi:C-terminal processing protease CtpA/Prc
MRTPLWIRKGAIGTAVLSTTGALVANLAWAQRISSIDREITQDMLKQVGTDVRKNYYDKNFHGIDWDAKLRETNEMLAKAPFLNTATLELAAALETLDDSHTFFVSPELSIRSDYGWLFQMVGTRCFVTEVEPKSDAERKGLKPGDEVLTIEGFIPARESLWKIEYALNGLRPLSGLQVELRDPSGKMRRLDVMARVTRKARIPNISDLAQAAEGRSVEEAIHLSRPRYEEINDLMILKLPNFLSRELAVQELIDKARKHKALIVDLRGNPGGSESTLLSFIGGVFDRDVKLANRVTRTGTTPVVAKSKHKGVFMGELIVLVDSKSGSAAELFARVVQIEKRGVVLGDLSSGSVMEAEFYPHQTYTGVLYGAMVTTADLVMTDGKSLERAGVTPDEKILPTAADLANGRDPVMVRAAEIAGVRLSPEKAAGLFPYEWPSEK